jgi:hypothetical protein
MDINEATSNFEDWLRKQLEDQGGIDEHALQLKHQDMKAEGVHAFLRGTFYRWAQLWTGVQDGGPVVPAVGDIHVENFGTWRDAEGRLVWGVNDFDEACELPWTSDLLRLGVSAQLAIETVTGFAISGDEACAVIIEGYSKALANGAGPFVLAEDQEPLRQLAIKLIVQKSPAKFWKKRDEKTEPAVSIPPSAEDSLGRALLPGAVQIQLRQPIAKDPPGMGSRGKRRFYAFAKWNGARVLRETKPIVPSALEWARSGPAGPGLAEMLLSPRRCPDPTHRIDGPWVVRRLAPDADKIELKDLASDDSSTDEERGLFASMGGELANLHLGAANASAVAADLAHRAASGDWFLPEVKKWRALVAADFDAFTPGP